MHEEGDLVVWQVHLICALQQPHQLLCNQSAFVVVLEEGSLVVNGHEEIEIQILGLFGLKRADELGEESVLQGDDGRGHNVLALQASENGQDAGYC